MDAVRAFRGAQSRDGKSFESYRSLLLGAFHFVTARACRDIRIVAHERGSLGVRPPSRMKWRSDPNFSTIRIGRRELVIHRDIAPQAAQIMQKLGDLTSAVQAGAGNRQSAYRLDLDGGVELFARRGRRGGMIASIISHVCVGMWPRQLT